MHHPTSALDSTTLWRPFGLDVHGRLQRRLAWYGGGFSIGDLTPRGKNTLLAPVRQAGRVVRCYEVDLTTGAMRLAGGAEAAAQEEAAQEERPRRRRNRAG